MTAPFIYPAMPLVIAVTVICGLVIVLLSLRRGPVRSSYGSWNRFIV